MILMTVICVYLWKTGVFTSQEKLKSFIVDFGLASGLVFVFI